VPTEASKPANPEARARAYAEGALGVDRAYEAAKAAVVAYTTARDDAGVANANRKKFDSLIADREIELTSDERAANSEMSMAAFEKHIKVVLHTDEALRDLRAQRDEAAGKHEQAERDADVARLTARVEAARLEELGGLLHFYAAVKASK